MFDRMIRRLCGVTVPLLALVLMLSAANSLFAQGNEGVQRVFAAWLPNTSTPLVCPDFLGEDSRRIVVAGRPGGGFEYFADNDGPPAPDEDWQVRDQDGNVLVDLRDGLWVFAPSVHITSQGADLTEFLWLNEVPPPGATCETGPSGTVIAQRTFLIKQIDDSGDPNDGAYDIVSGGADRRICVGIAVFNR